MEDDGMNGNSEKIGRAELLHLSKEKISVKQKRRYDTVLLYLEGYSRLEISTVLHIPRRTVSTYITLYQEGGVEALLIKKQTGREKKLTDEQEQELYQVISSCTPEEAGIGIFANWTALLACRLVEDRFHVTFSERGMRDLFYRIGLSYTRPTYTLNKADPEKTGYIPSVADFN